ncbi:kynurenine 3-monooxygenase, mitochondrial precursor [Scheffersomyces spartinae]|uniref:Kynurenine 3-monooxygenase n=1 Tax=Scheffersomyces spartinae TaxID=45513 RepID=A0A9P7VBT8_9ASCO|nr:kynurenine 3-monooxygenase, mitochondrial precursor [Scheffersomyces spartinae]KAG7194915.1 kynurenine 3-monooxygenase, mitochondrial precursor [Scheffersomyces spartinae]
MSRGSVGIVGAGLVGSLAALTFLTKGFEVTLYEARPDPRTTNKDRNLRSINLAVSSRGLEALKYVGEELEKRILEEVIPMKGRMIHDVKGNQESQIYGLFGEAINSIDRAYLNDLLLEELVKKGVQVHFNHKLIKVDTTGDKQKISFINSDTAAAEATEPVEVTGSFDYIIGADGAHSQFRYQLQRSMRMSISQNYIDMQYIELYIPPNISEGSSLVKSKFSIDPNHLHIWPRHNFMLIALANKDGSFTSTFFLPWETIEAIKSPQEFLEFFETNFPDATSLIGGENLKEAYRSHPRGSLMQISAYPYHHPNGKAIIIGDAAHLMVPFYGQGMNCGFEDVRVLMQMIETNDFNVEKSFEQYSLERKKDLDCICDLAMANFKEMSSKVVDPFYLLRKKLDYVLGKYFNGVLSFQWIPLYTMISFRADISYSKAIAIEKRQKKILKRVEYLTIGSILTIGLIQAAKTYNRLKRD